MKVNFKTMKHSTPSMRLKFQKPASSFNEVSLYQVFQKKWDFLTCEHISHGSGMRGYRQDFWAQLLLSTSLGTGIVYVENEL